MTTIKKFILLYCLLIISSCSSPSIVEINITNELDISRVNETIEVNLHDVPKLLSSFTPEQLFVRDGMTDQVVLSQLIDLDEDKIPDLLIFQTDFAPNESKHFHLEGSKEIIDMPVSEKSTFARFVPERIDDFAWENDKVAFRTYGPKAQALTEAGDPGGTLSSGIDCWLKRVEYPIINKWYKQDLEEGKSYHVDHGEGLDNYQVGPSRGTGGTGIWKDGNLFTSQNFKNWKVLANGPIRSIFELEDGTWEADGLSIQEKKRISIDLGSNLFKCTMILGNYAAFPNIALGIALHDKMGQVYTNKEKGWFRYCEPNNESELCNAIIVDQVNVNEIIDNRIDQPDLSNLLVVCLPKAELSYYAGFAWGKSNQFDLPDGFDKYLDEFASRLNSPIKIEIKE